MIFLDVNMDEETKSYYLNKAQEERGFKSIKQI